MPSAPLQAAPRQSLDPIPVFYAGGCTFVPDQRCVDFRTWKVLATFENSLPAIVRGQVGQGTVLLSSVHPEFGWDDLQNLPDVEGTRLGWSNEDETQRQALWTRLLNELNL